jgi:serine/threonine protein phosphatase PrpC
MMTIRPKAFDMQGVKLSAQEGFVLSRVVGPTSVAELIDLSGFDEPTVLAILRRLVDEGTLDVEPPFATTAAETNATVAVCGMTDVGLARSNNEDAFRVVDLGAGDTVDASQHTLVELGPRGMLLVVCDGMGGENAGEVASALAVEVISSHMASVARDLDAVASLRAAVDHANELVVAAADDPGRKGMGTTVVAVLIRGADAFTAEVGDSRAYVMRRGVLTQITKDQTYVQLLLDQGLLPPDAVKSSVAKNVVLQAVGKAPELIVAQRRLSLRGGDQLLLCSDGLSSFVTDEEITSVLASSVSLDQACSELIALANERGGHDNITVVTALVGTADAAVVGAAETVADTLTTIKNYAVGEPSDDPDANADAD